MMDGSSLSKEAFSAKKSKLFAGMLFGAIFVWLLVSLIQGPAQLITGVDRESLGYQSQDFSPDFNQAVTRAETALYGKNRGYAIFWHAKRVLVALGAISGVIAAAIAFMKQASPARSQRNLAQSVAVVCGLVAAICPPAISYVDNEADVFLLAGKELMNGIEAAIAQARTNPAAEADVVLELNALVRKHTLEFF